MSKKNIIIVVALVLVFALILFFISRPAEIETPIGPEVDINFGPQFPPPGEEIPQPITPQPITPQPMAPQPMAPQPQP